MKKVDRSSPDYYDYVAAKRRELVQSQVKEEVVVKSLHELLVTEQLTEYRVVQIFEEREERLFKNRLHPEVKAGVLEVLDKKMGEIEKKIEGMVDAAIAKRIAEEPKGRWERLKKYFLKR